MKAMPFYLVILVLLCSFYGSAQSKQFPDSIRIELPDQASFLVFEMRRYASDKSMIQQFPADLSVWLEHVKKSITQSDLAKPHDIEIRLNNENGKLEPYTMKISEPETKTTRVMAKDNTIVQLLPPGWEISIFDKRAHITVYAPDFERLEQLTQVSLQPAIARLDSDPAFDYHKRMGIISRLILSNDVIHPDKTTHRLPADMLGLHAGAGVGLLQDKLYPEFNFTTALYFSNRFKANHQRIALSYELKFLSGRSVEGAYRSTPGQFLSLSYGINFSKERPRWTALGVGYLIHNKAELFSGKTMKIFLETDVGSPKLNIMPELYLTDDFRKSLFGVKLNYKF